MKLNNLRISVLSCLFIFILLFSLLSGQEDVDFGKIVGNWDIEVDAEGEFYYLILTVKSSDGSLSGVISDSSGFFTDVPISNIQFDGDSFSFEFDAPTPPDGVERLLRADFSTGEDTLEGFIAVDELGITARASGKRKNE